MKLIIAVLYVISLQAFAAGADPSCYVDPRTSAATCVDLSQTKVKDSIRSNIVFTGGSLGMTKTSYTININCTAKIAHLKDRQGVSFAGGSSGSSPVLWYLTNSICDHKIKSVSK